MGINKLVDASCDDCGESFGLTFWHVKDLKETLRVNAWFVGSKILCPTCNFNDTDNERNK